MDAAAAARNEELIKRGHPKGLYMLFMVEMWERFNYYGMRALLTLFMISSVIGFSKNTAYEVYAWFTGLVYFTPVLGGWIADKFIGKRHSITIGAILMAAGQFTLASYGFLPAKVALFGGLALIIFGNGFFKPNISAIVGELYEPNDPRRDGGFTIFYMGINVGALIAPFITGYVGEVTATSASWVQWRWGFMTAGIGMVISLIWYLTQQKKFLGDIGLRPVSKSTAPNAAELNKPLTSQEKDRLLAIFTFTFIAIFFFAFFEQAGSSLSVFASESINRIINLPFVGLYEIKASWFQSINPIAVVILAPLFAKMWINMGKKDKEPSTPVKFGWGIFLTGVGFLVLAFGARFLVDGPINMMWLIVLFVIHTCGELCLSPVGLSMVTKLSPAKLVSLMMGIWLTAAFLGNIMAGYFAKLSTSWTLTQFLTIPGIILIVFALLVWAFAGKIRQWMHGIN